MPSNQHCDVFAVGDVVRWDDTQTTHTGRINQFTDGGEIAVVIAGPCDVANVALDSLYR